MEEPEHWQRSDLLRRLEGHLKFVLLTHCTQRLNLQNIEASAYGLLP